ncbi:hypothetical protein LCGC14_2820150, partial [marine sediment metagenome]
MGKLSRAKGAAWEREVANRVRAALGGENTRIRRMWQDQQQHGNADVFVPGFHLEAKVGKLTNPRAALRQAEDDMRKEGLIAIAVCKDNSPGGGVPAFETVTMRFDDFLELFAALVAQTGPHVVGARGE